MKYAHSRPARAEDKGSSPGAVCDGEIVISEISGDPSGIYQRFECKDCGAGISIPKTVIEKRRKEIDEALK